MVDRWTYGLRAERLRQSREVEAGGWLRCVPVVVLVRVPDVAAQRHARPKRKVHSHGGGGFEGGSNGSMVVRMVQGHSLVV